MQIANTQDLLARLALAKTLARQARRLTLRAYQQGISSQNKNEGGHYDPVTQIDIDTETLLRGLISEAYPDDGIEGEEFPEKTSANNWVWTLDPIDGTRAFIAGVPVWSTLIAVSYNHIPVIGIIDLPALSETYIGANGKAYKQTPSKNITLKTRKYAKLDSAILSCTSPLSMFSPAQFSAYKSVSDQARFSRLGLDAYGYALVASGRIDLVLEADIKPYDICAVIPIIQGAGGIIQTWEGRSANNGGAIVCAGHRNLLLEISPILNKPA